MTQAVLAHTIAAARPTLDPAVLSKATMTDLLCLYDAFERADQAMLCIVNMPRCEVLASDVIEQEQERLRWLETPVVEEVRRREVDGWDLERQAEVLARFAFRASPFEDNDPRLKAIIALTSEAR